jgi:hypothetical protein
MLSEKINYTKLENAIIQSVQIKDLRTSFKCFCSIFIIHLLTTNFKCIIDKKFIHSVGEFILTNIIFTAFLLQFIQKSGAEKI